MDLTIRLKLFSYKRTFTINKQWLQFGVIFLVVLASSVIPYWGSRTIFALIIILAGGIAVVITLLRQPNLGFIFIFLGGMFLHFTGPSGINAAAVTVALMLGLWIMDMFVVKRNIVFIRSQVMLPIVSFLVIAMLAFGMGQIPWFIFARQAPLDAQLGGFGIVLLSIGALLLSAHLIKDLYWLKIIVWVFVGLGTFYVTGRALQLSFIDRLYHWGFSAGSMYWTWLVALTAGQIIYNNELKTRVRILLIGIVLLILYVAIGQAYDWKSGWLPPLVALAVLIGNRFRKLALLALPFMAIAGIYLVYGQIASDDYSWGTRVDAWLIILTISRVSPLLGMGFANYYWYTPLFPIRGFNVNFNSHSQFVDLIAQTGYIGLLCFLWLFIALGKLSWNMARKTSDGFAQAYSYSVLAGIAGSMVAAFLVDWILPFVYNIGFTGFRASILPWIFMGGVIAIEQMEIRKSTS